jgi:hypothetical protein
MGKNYNKTGCIRHQRETAIFYAANERVERTVSAVDRAFHARWENKPEYSEPSFNIGASRVGYPSRQ